MDGCKHAYMYVCVFVCACACGWVYMLMRVLVCIMCTLCAQYVHLQMVTIGHTDPNRPAHVILYVELPTDVDLHGVQCLAVYSCGAGCGCWVSYLKKIVGLNFNRMSIVLLCIELPEAIPVLVSPNLYPLCIPQQNTNCCLPWC